MACTLSAIQAAACLSGIGKEQSRIKLLQWIAQLTCEAAEAGAGGGGSEFTIETFAAPAFPFNYAATSRATVEVYALMDTGDTGDLGGYQAARTGAPNMQVSFGSGNANEAMQDVASYRLGPGQSIALTNISTGQGICQILQVVVYSE